MVIYVMLFYLISSIDIICMTYLLSPPPRPSVATYLLAEDGEAEEVTHHAQAGGEDGGHAGQPEQQRLQQHSVQHVNTKIMSTRIASDTRVVSFENCQK